jgi:hypothetical protein
MAIVPDTARFRPMPKLSQSLRVEALSLFGNYDGDRIQRCAESTGHVLRVREKKVFCERCPAVWRDEGF